MEIEKNEELIMLRNCAICILSSDLQLETQLLVVKYCLIWVGAQVMISRDILGLVICIPP